MKTHLILQVLGNSDIQVDGEPGYKLLEGSSNESGIREVAQQQEEELLQNIIDVEFPLIKQLRESLAEKYPQDRFKFGLILTDQVRWLNHRNASGGEWDRIASSDGIWWQNILAAWCERQEQPIEFYPIVLDIDPNIPHGVADWEGMASTVENILKTCLVFENNEVNFLAPQTSEKISVDRIIIQYSSGTPALSSALYLWGIENKLAGKNVEFIYISEQELEYLPHSGNHWQWRLKVPQIRELLQIQDFSGALKLLDSSHPRYQELLESLSFLDKSVSLNIEESKLEGKESVIERISIAIWSEKAFRDRSQWLHWYLRMAGAIESALYLLLEKQGNNNYKWEKHKLIFKPQESEKKIEVRFVGISKIVDQLLSTGQYVHRDLDNTEITLETQTINDPEWKDFKKFYSNEWLKKNEHGFNPLRNDLFHNLRGDFIDRLLDEKTKKFNGKVDHKEHPSQVAVDRLEYIIQLADLSDEVKLRSDKYRDRVTQIFQIL